ncbi:MAG: mechanosensitive ion channel domain-containing protein [Thermoplasmata archaeon]
MLSHALDVTQDLTGFLVTSWPALVLTAFLTVAILYVIAYANRFFEYLKAQESKYLGRRTLNLLRRTMLGTWIGLILILVLVAFAGYSPEIKSFLRIVVLHVPSVLVVVFSLTASVASAQVVGRFLSYLRGQLEEKPEKVLSARSFVVTEMVSKYSLYALGLVVGVLGGLGLLPPEDVLIRTLIDQAIFTPLAPLLDLRYLTALLTTLIFMVIAARLADSVFSDFRKRTRKFTPRIVDLFRSVTKYTIFVAAALAIIFLTLALGLSADQLILIGLIIVLMGLAATLVLHEPISNALSGIALINTDPFREGERIKIGDSLVCDVLEVNLTNTKVKTLKDELVNIPNRELLSKSIMNFSRSKSYALTVDVTVSFDTPHSKVESLLTEAAKKTEGIIGDPQPHVFARKIEGDTVSYELWAYVSDPKEMKRTRSDLIARAQELFHEEGFKLLSLQV